MQSQMPYGRTSPSLVLTDLGIPQPRGTRPPRRGEIASRVLIWPTQARCWTCHPKAINHHNALIAYALAVRAEIEVYHVR